MLLWSSVALALPALDEPVRTGARSDADSAVVIGIEDYFVLPDVPYAKRDADVMYELFLYTRGIPSDRVQLLDKGANREQILAAVEEAGERTSKGGRVWVYFSGHGAASPDTGERVLLGVDTQSDLATFRSRAVTVAELRKAASAGGGEALLVLDTCYSGRSRTGDDLVGGKRFAVPTWAGEPATSVAEWTAAGPDEWSGPLEAAQHGAFTYLVAGALRGWADGQRDGERDGQVTLEEAHLYVTEGLRSLGVTDQRPVLAGQGSWVLSTGDEEAPALDATVASSGTPTTAVFTGDPSLPGQIQVSIMAMAIVFVDGAPVPMPETDGLPPPLLIDGLSAGKHLVEIRGAFGKPITSMDVMVGGGEQVRLQYRKKQLTEIGRGPAVEPPAPSVGDLMKTVVTDPFRALDTAVAMAEAKKAAPAPVATTGSLGPAQVQQLLMTLEDLTFSSDQIAHVRAIAPTTLLTAAQVGQILDVFPHSDDRVQVVRILAGSIVDPQNVDHITSHCTFMDEKRQITEALAALGR